MVNVKAELMETLKSKNKEKKDIKCAYINYCKAIDENPDNYDEKIIVLKINFSDEEYENFLKELDFEYDNRDDMQEFEGLVWFTDNSWLERERSEFDGKEWWKCVEYPKINPECLR